MTLPESSFDNPVYSSELESHDRSCTQECKPKERMVLNEERASSKQAIESSWGESQNDLESGTPSRNYRYLESLQKFTKAIHNRRGLFMASLAALFYSGKSMFMDLLTLTVDPFQTIVMLMPMMLIGSFAVLVLKRIPPPRALQHYVWLLLCGCAVASYLCSFSFSLAYLEVADSVSILYSSLIFVGLISWIILKEKLFLFDFIFALFSFAGVIFISRPHFIFRNINETSDDQNDLFIGVGFALASSFSVAMSFTIVRKHSHLGIHTFMSVFCSAVVGTITNALICTAMKRWQVPTKKEWLYATAAGFCYISAQGSLFVSLSMETATLVNIIMAAEILFTFLWQFWFLGLAPSWTSYVGALLIIFACVGITLKKDNSANQN